MTIDKAIAHAREASAIQRNNDKLNKTLGANSPYYNTDCLKCAEEHEQLAEWLERKEERIITPEDLVKMIKQREKEISCENCMFCNLGPYHDGLWYCSNRSILKIPEDISGCFRRSRRK